MSKLSHSSDWYVYRDSTGIYRYDMNAKHDDVVFIGLLTDARDKCDELNTSIGLENHADL